MKELKTSMKKCECPNCGEDYSKHQICDELDCDTLYLKNECPNCGSEDDVYEALKELDYYEWHK